MLLVLGDAHADEPGNREALLAAYAAVDVDHVLQVGDLQHYDLPVPTWFIAGNNEDFDVIEELRRGGDASGVTNAHLLSSDVVVIEDIRVSGLSGNFAPTQFQKSRSELLGDRRRHFVRTDVQQAKALTDIDVFLTHEAPHGLIRSKGYDPGCQHVDAILRELEPSLCLVGHHHQHAEGTFGPTTVVGLAPVWESYYTLDPTTLKLDRYPAAALD